MTSKQLETLKSLARYREENGRMPSFRELARERRVAVRTIQKSIAALVAVGAVRVSGGRCGFSIEPPGAYELRKADGMEW